MHLLTRTKVVQGGPQSPTGGGSDGFETGGAGAEVDGGGGGVGGGVPGSMQMAAPVADEKVLGFVTAALANLAVLSQSVPALVADGVVRQMSTLCNQHLTVASAVRVGLDEEGQEVVLGIQVSEGVGAVVRNCAAAFRNVAQHEASRRQVELKTGTETEN